MEPWSPLDGESLGLDTYDEFICLLPAEAYAGSRLRGWTQLIYMQALLLLPFVYISMKKCYNAQ